MPDVAAILSRVRAQGADIVLADGRMTLAGGAKLSAEARAYITEHRAVIAAYLQEQRADAIDERAAIIEFDAGAPREWAEQFARILYQRRPAGVADLDWTWFVTTCGRMIDEAPERSAA